jgi:hypothetical protein
VVRIGIAQDPFSAAVELNELDRLTENGPVYERQGEARRQRKEWENSALLSPVAEPVIAELKRSAAGCRRLALEH